MGVILQGILGGFSGKVGPVVGGKWKDIDYMRSYVIPSNPNTVNQQAVRTKFSKLVQYGRSLLATILQPFWDPFYSNMSGFNAFISTNYDTLDGSNFLQASSVIAKGTLETVHSNTSTYNSATGAITVTYSGEILGNGLDGDLVYAVAVDRSTGNFYFSVGDDTRNALSIEITAPTGLTATNITTWVFAYRGTGSELVVSDSIGDVCAAP